MDREHSMTSNFGLSVLFIGLSTYCAVAQTDNILYCSDEAANGFQFKEGKYVPSLFLVRKFTVTMDLENNIARINTTGNIEENYKCTSFSDGVLSCTDGAAYMFNINISTKRYIRANGLGDLNGKGSDSIIISYGSCAIL
jgi:hypothetical protein